MIEKVKVLDSLELEEKNVKTISLELCASVKSIYRNLNKLVKIGLIQKKGFPALYSLTSNGRFVLEEEKHKFSDKFSLSNKFSRGVNQ